MFPERNIIRFDFPARGAMPPVKIFWYDALKAPFRHPSVPETEALGDKSNNGSLFLGEKGMVTTGCYGERTRLVPASKMKGYKLPPRFLTRSPGHYRDWIRACKGGEPACSEFSVAGPFTEWVVMGVIALHFEGKLRWDSAKMRFTNNQEANRYVKPAFRKGWSFT